MKKVLLPAVYILTSANLWSAIGKTKEQCDELYGGPTGHGTYGQLTSIGYNSPSGPITVYLLKKSVCVSVKLSYQKILKKDRNGFILKNLQVGESLPALKERKSAQTGVRTFVSPVSKRTVILGKGYVTVNSESFYVVNNQDKAYAKLLAENQRRKHQNKAGNPFTPYEPDFYRWEDREKERRAKQEQSRRAVKPTTVAKERQSKEQERIEKLIRARKLALSYKKEQTLVNAIAGAITDAAIIINQNGGNVSYGLGALKAPIDEGDFQGLESTWGDCVRQASQHNVRVDAGVNQYIDDLRHLRNER